MRATLAAAAAKPDPVPAPSTAPTVQAATSSPPTSTAAGGKLCVVTGPMFAGKTTALLKQAEDWRKEGHIVTIVKPLQDNRYSVAQVVSHSGQSTCADRVV